MPCEPPSDDVKQISMLGQFLIKPNSILVGLFDENSAILLLQKTIRHFKNNTFLKIHMLS